MPSEHSAFCKYFRKGYQGKSQLEPKHQQRASICDTAGPDTKTLAQKAHTYLPILCEPKESTRYSVSNTFTLSYWTQTRPALKQQSVEFFLTKKACPVAIYQICQAEWSTFAPKSLCLVFQTKCVLSPLRMENQATHHCFPTTWTARTGQWRRLCLTWVNKQSVCHYHWAVWEFG